MDSRTEVRELASSCYSPGGEDLPWFPTKNQTTILVFSASGSVDDDNDVPSDSRWRSGPRVGRGTGVSRLASVLWSLDPAVIVCRASATV